jgi:hypothetical protein
MLKRAAIWGVVLGLGIVAWTFAMGFLGWYRDPDLAGLFGLVLPFQIAVVITALRSTRKEQTYMQQLGMGVALSAIGGVLAFCGSMLFTKVVFPEYFDEIRALAIEQGASEAELAATEWQRTSFFSAAAGAFGTLVTGFAVSAITAIFARKKR